MMVMTLSSDVALFPKISAWLTPVLSSSRALLNCHLIGGDLLKPLNKEQNLTLILQQSLVCFFSIALLTECVCVYIREIVFFSRI